MKRKFECTPAGVVSRGQRTLTVFLVSLSLGMLVVAVAVWISGRIFPGFLALGVSVLTFVAWRMSCELNLEWLQISDGVLTLRAVHQQIHLPIADLSIRRLDSSEIEHLERLASTGGIVVGSGGFDSHILGEFDLYATNLHNSVLIESPGSRLVVTPDEPDEFIEILKDQLNQSNLSGGPATILGS
jgi:hypothetical protein